MKKQLSYSEKAGRLIRLIGWLSLIIISVGISAALLIPILATDEDLGQVVEAIILTAFLIGISIFYLIVGGAVKKNKKWGKIVGVVIALLSLLNFPIGTIIGIFILVYLRKGWNEKQTQINSNSIQPTHEVHG